MKSFVVILAIALVLMHNVVQGETDELEPGLTTTNCDSGNCVGETVCDSGNCEESCGGPCNCAPRCAPACVSRCRSCSSGGSYRCYPRKKYIVMPPPASPPSSPQIVYDEPNRTSEAAMKNDVSNNVTTIFELTSVVSNNNTIHIPVEHSYNHKTDVHIIPAAAPSININITNPSLPISYNFSTVTQPPIINQEPCCTIPVWKDCNYTKEGQLNCTRSVQQFCGIQCLIRQNNSQPIYIPVPVGQNKIVNVPHPVPVYYPVHHVQRVPVPVPQTVHVQVPQPVPVPFPQPYPVTRHIPVPVPQLQPYPVLKHVPVAVPQLQPYPVEVTRNIPVPVPQPQPYPVPVTQYVPIVQRYPVPTPCQQQTVWQQQPSLCQIQQQQQQNFQTSSNCPISIWNGRQYPCTNNQVTTNDGQFITGGVNTIGTNLESGCKIVGQYPWIECNKQGVRDCKSCLFCDGEYNPLKCTNSQFCTEECKKAMTALNSNQGRMLNCSVVNSALKCV